MQFKWLYMKTRQPETLLYINITKRTDTFKYLDYFNYVSIFCTQ